ncbi:hypothetical protein [Rhizobium sp.]
MAKVKFTALLGAHTYIGDLFTNLFNLELATDEPKKAVYRDTESGTQMILRGSGFEYDGDVMTEGTIKSIVFANEDGKRYATIGKGEWDPQEFISAYFSEGFEGMAQYVLEGRDKMIGSKKGDLLQGEDGKDRIIGGKGADWIYGNGGNDRLTGGKGSDHFLFYPGDGKDVITDFDAVGGGKKQDYLGIEPSHTFEQRDTKAGLLLEFDDGGSLLLLGVHKLNKMDFLEFS